MRTFHKSVSYIVLCDYCGGEEQYVNWSFCKWKRIKQPRKHWWHLFSTSKDQCPKCAHKLETKSVIANQGMHSLLTTMIEVLSGFQAKEEMYMDTLIKDLQTTLNNYNNRYDKEEDK